MYSPAERPSRTRAAPAKKRRLSEQTGISSFAYASGLPTFRDSSSASSSACSSIASASFSNDSARSAGVVSSHWGSARFAAWTARSTSAAEARGTSAIVSPVAGLSTSIVSPPAASTHSPPIRLWCLVTVVLTDLPPSQDPGVARQALRDPDGNDGHYDDEEDDDVHLRQLLAEAQVSEDPDRQRVLRAGGERRHDDLVERERERQQRSRDERGRDDGEGDVAEGLPAVGAEVHRGLRQRCLRAAQARDDVVVDDHYAEGRVADHDRPERRPQVVNRIVREEGVEGDPGDDARQRDRQDEQECDGVAAEEPETADRRRRGRPEHERHSRCEAGC